MYVTADSPAALPFRIEADAESWVFDPTHADVDSRAPAREYATVAAKRRLCRRLQVDLTPSRSERSEEPRSPVSPANRYLQVGNSSSTRRPHLKMRQTLFTLGYQQRTLDEFVSILAESRIDVLVDVRETAWSHKPGFSKGGLQAALAANGIDYIHADFAGNPKWLRANAGSHRECLDWYSWYLGEFDEIVPAFEQLLAEQLREGRRVCVTCFERHPDDCHRAILAARWQARGARRVKHLATEGCERLLSA